jgi:hypothetical protein
VRLRRAWLAGAALALGASLPARGETVQLFPGGPDHWGARNVFAPFTSIFLGPRYWYGERKIEVKTTPADAVVDLFYVRAGFQKRFEQAEAPVTILLPKRINAYPQDVVIVRAFAAGHRIVETTVKVKSRTDELLLEMDPLPNVLQAISRTYFGGRTSLSFLTQEALTLRVQDRKGGFAVALHETAKSEELGDSLESIHGPLIAGLQAHQLGEDLLVQVEYGTAAKQGKTELRSRQGHDAIRDVHVYSLDLIGPGAGAEAVERTKAALTRIRRSDVTGCAAVFDDALRDALDPAALSRALTPKGSFTDPYLRAAMRRLGEVSPGGVIALEDGTRYHPDTLIQLAAAQNQASKAKGYLALLRRLVVLLEPAEQRRAVLHGLVAPELPLPTFAEAMDGADSAERRCKRGLARLGPGATDFDLQRE